MTSSQHFGPKCNGKMNNDKRRRARVQGGWAAPSKAVRSDAHKPKMPSGPAWLAKTVDKPAERKFVYETPDEPVRQKPKEKVIDKGGVFDVSTSENGISRLRYFPNFIEPKETEWIFEQLFHELPWQQKYVLHQGEMFLQPRLTAWYGDLSYNYSGVTQEANTHWHPVLTMLKDRLEETTGYTFNSMLANLYRDGKDSVDWHSDDEPSLRRNPTIASLSFGDTRNFELRRKPPREENGDYTYMEHIKIPLTNGSLLIMEGATQEDWQHRVPKEYHDRDARINLTFRVIYAE